jgi:hypothetical protein
MIRWAFLAVAVVILGVPDPLRAQAVNPANPYPSAAAAPGNQGAAPPTSNYGSNPQNYGGVPNPGASYGSNPANYVSTPGLGHTKDEATPQQRAAEQQSGLNEAAARSLLEQKGYKKIGGVEADPDSLWVWQADVMKDGRPTRVGIDYRGDVLDLSSTQAQPCAVPGVQLGVVGNAVGSRLSQSDACANH